jgi:hypothetical protein
MYATVERRVIIVSWTMLKNSSCTLLAGGGGGCRWLKVGRERYM